jgi:two-component system cell cycle response regulator DivK
MSNAITNKPGRFNGWNRKTVLIVEDDLYNHSYLEELLSDTEINMLHAWDGEEAVAIVEKHQDIALVLMDIKMPVMDGLSATRIIKNIRPKLPVIAQTANALSKDRTLALEAGCDDYLLKPIEREVFMKKMSAYLA